MDKPYSCIVGRRETIECPKIQMLASRFEDNLEQVSEAMELEHCFLLLLVFGGVILPKAYFNERLGLGTPVNSPNL